MKAFPGFEDQAAFPVKFSEILDQVAGAATDGQQSYQTDIKPWFGGQIGASIGPIPTAADPAAARALLLLSTTDGAKASAWAAGIAQEAGATTSTEPYNGTTITLVTPKDGASGEMQAAYAVEGSVLAIGDPTSVKASIDTQGKTGLNTVPQFTEAAASISGDRLGFAYVDLAAIVKGAQSLAGAAGDIEVLAQPIGDLPAMLGDAVAPWAVFALRAQDGALIVDTRSPHTAASGPVSNAESKLPGLVPATTVFLAEGHDVGKVLARTKDALAAEPSLKDAVKQVDDILGILGGFEAVLGLDRRGGRCRHARW